MAKTILRVRQGGIAYYLNESSTGAKNSGRRFILSRTSNFGKTKDGWIKVNSTEHQVLVDANSELDQFNACTSLFASKEQRPHVDRHHIRGMAGKWEGEAFPARVTHRRDATQNANNENVSRQVER
ncbi:hypothetical protein [Pseudomonas sp. RA_35y_Pfl2_P32]|uniref:hypothetical protein n=1 Tax=Pseudomonas sp. RA_35y_Pfl2_P32 TaxID=3088705 RepID=UPI0030D73C67